uniref:Uncharacterized protein n=1 Tax=Arundo donax TaxID=35708 RepID=A0A0A9BML9_ARUDO
MQKQDATYNSTGNSKIRCMTRTSFRILYPSSDKIIVDLDKFQVYSWVFIGLAFSSVLSYLRGVSACEAISSCTCKHSFIPCEHTSRHSILNG